MAVEAPLSRYKRTNFVIYIGICLGLAGWFAYDGYINESFIEKYTDEDGNPQWELVVNQQAPPYLVGAAVLLAGYYLVIRKRKVVADEEALIVAGKETIPYDAIEAIDKTHFEKKGFFTIIYARGNGTTARRKLSTHQYDNLSAILDLVIAKIT